MTQSISGERTPGSGRSELITYPTSLGGSLSALGTLLAGPLDGVFPGGVHILPPFPSTADRGFAPVRYDEIDPAHGTWADIEQIAARVPVTLDIMVNHISRFSPEFQDVVARGNDSAWIDAFITPGKIWPETGWPSAADLELIHLRKPDHPFTDVTLADGTTLTVWTTFAFGTGPSQQIDLDARSPVTRDLYRTWFAELARHGVRRVRLDAVGYLSKRAGTSCFMVDPDIWELLADLADLAAANGLTVLPEVHAGTDMHRTIASRGYASYDFALPGLVLHALIAGTSSFLRPHLDAAPANQITMLDCHDGIPSYPDLEGMLADDELGRMAEHARQRGANFTMAHDRHAGASRVHQINCTYRDAVGSDTGLLVSRAIQLFAPGTPQIYYVGLLAGSNVPIDESGDGRSVNRHDYSEAEISRGLASPVVQRQIELLRLRNTHPAFDGTLTVLPSADTALALLWSGGESWCRLDVDLPGQRAEVSWSGSQPLAVHSLELA